MNNVKSISADLVIIFNNEKIKNGTLLPLNFVQSQPKFHFPIEENKLYTFIIVDPDAPAGYIIHQCVYNISLNPSIKATQYYIYIPPNPPAGSGPNKDGKHKYYCILYEQNEKVTGRKPIMGRGFKDYDDFKKLLGVSLDAIAYKFFFCKTNY